MFNTKASYIFEERAVSLWFVTMTLVMTIYKTVVVAGIGAKTVYSIQKDWHSCVTARLAK